MALRRNLDRVEQLRTTIVQLKLAAAEDRRVALRCRELVAARGDAVDDLAEQEASGALSRAAVDERLEQLEREAAGHTLNAEARERAADMRERNIAPLEAEIAQLLIADDVAELQKALDDRGAHDREFAKRVDALFAEATKLRRAQDREAKAWAALAGTTTDFSVTDHDAPDWAGDTDDLIRLLQDGPYQPVSHSEAETRRLDAARAARAQAKIDGARNVAAAREKRDQLVIGELVREYAVDGLSEAELTIRLSSYIEPLRSNAIAAILSASKQPIPVEA